MSASLAPECNELKEKYDACFLKWFSEKYLRGSSSTDECADLFKKYNVCLTKTLKEKGIDQMIQEARDSTTPETDAEHLRRAPLIQTMPRQAPR